MARLRDQFMPGVDLSLSEDIGGFGVGRKFSWQAIAAGDFEFARTKSVTWKGVIGYKALFVDYTRGSGPSHVTDE